MSDDQLLSRITVDPKVMVGKAVIKGTRLTVEHILGLFAHGATVGEILEEYTGLAPEDIQACFLFASKSLQNTSFLSPEDLRMHHWWIERCGVDDPNR